jgi:hypothetical protein
LQSKNEETLNSGFSARALVAKPALPADNTSPVKDSAQVQYGLAAEAFLSRNR